jgi:hypothetical protein
MHGEGRVLIRHDLSVERRDHNGKRSPYVACRQLPSSAGSGMVQT